MSRIKRNEIPSMDVWMKEAKADPNAEKVGMYLIHNGTVRKSAKAKVRLGEENAADVVGMEFSYDQELVKKAVADTYQMEGIYYVRVWLNSGHLEVGDDLMYVLVGGDIRPHVIAALEALVGQLKNHCVAEKELYAKEKQVGCIIMASGESKRFGGNKLLAEFKGQTLIQKILDTTEQVPFTKRAVLTRCKEVAEICKAQKVEVIFHDRPYRNEAVALGVEAMKEMDACLFCPCDQPFLSAESVGKMIETWKENPGKILRLSWKGREGSPILFDKTYFKELMELPEKCGGSYLTKQHPEQVCFVEAERDDELEDIDTPGDYERLLERR